MKPDDLKVGKTYELSGKKPPNPRWMPIKQIYDITLFKGKRRVYFYSVAQDGSVKMDRHHHGNDMLADEFAERVIREIKT